MKGSRRCIAAGIVWLALTGTVQAQALMKVSTAYTRTFLMVDSADHFTGKTGLTVTCKISKAGATGVTPGGTISQVDSTNNPGVYKIVYTTTDTNTLGDLWGTCSASGADITDFRDQVVAFDPADAVAFGLSRIDAAITSRMATFTVPTNFGVMVIDSNGRVQNQQSVMKNTAFTDYKFAMFDATTGAPKTGLVNADFTKQEAIDAAAWTSLSGTITEVGNGVYKISFTAGELNGNSIMFRMAAAAAGASDSMWEIFPGK